MMGTYNYVPLQEKANELITKYGAEVKILREGSGGDWTKKFDPATSRPYWEDSSLNVVYIIPAIAAVEYPGNAIIGKWPLNLIERGVVESSDARVLIAIDEEVHNGDILVMASGREYQIVPPINRVSPDGDVIIVQEINARG